MARITLSEAHGDQCATADCNNRASIHFEAGGIGSDYCEKCIDAIRKSVEKDAPKCIGCRQPLVEGISLFRKFGDPMPGYWHDRCHQDRFGR